MAIQFPNFLSAQTHAPDYSGLADIVQNYYAGKAMPKDDLIKQIQAKFAQPNAEAALRGTNLSNESTRLSNSKAGMEIQKLAMELQQQRDLENQLRKALSGGGAMPANPANNPVSSAISQAVQQGQGGGAPAGGGMPAMPAANRMNYTPINAPQPGMNAPASPDQGQPPMAMPKLTADQIESALPPASEPSEVVISKGEPHLAGIDAMYDNNPLSRAFLEKKGYKKTTSVKFDNKTGKTTLITQYPSGKVTVTSAGGIGAGGEGMPLTNKMVSKHQNVIASVDVAAPILDQIADMKDNEYSRWSTTNRGAKYNGLVKQALDSVLGAFGLPSTDKGLDSVLAQLQIGHLESAAAYRKRIKELKADLEKRKKYSADQVKKAVVLPDDGSETTPLTSNIGDTDPIWGDNQ